MNFPALFRVAAIAAITALPTLALGASVNFPAGTEITGILQQELSTKGARDGQRFTVVTTSGSVIQGHLSEVVSRGLTKKAHMKLNFDRIRFSDGTSAPIVATVSQVAEKKKYNLLQAGGTALAGNIVGNVVGKTLFGAKGGGLLGLAGGALVAANTSADLDIAAKSAMTIKLTEPLIVRPQARR